MLELLNILLSEFRERLRVVHERALERDFRFPHLPQKIKVAIGMRRVGKTHCLLQKINALLAHEALNIEQILYLNLEDDRLLPCSQAQLCDLIDAFYTLYPENHDRVCYLFLDEIQNVEEWPLLIRRLFDSKKVQIYLSGSSSKLLSKEIHTSLRGRAIAAEVWPFSFLETLKTGSLNFTDQLLGQKQLDILRQQLRVYLAHGGFPEVLADHLEQRRQVLQDYVNVTVMRDVIERHDITNITLIKYMIKHLLRNVGSPFAINKFYNDLKTQGLSAAKNTLYDYLDYIEDAYLIFALPLYSESIRKTQVNPRKIYAVDSGLVNAYTFSQSTNYGHLFENLIYLELRRQKHEIYYFLTQDRYEVDFLTINPEGQMKLYQVVWDVTNEKTLQREMRALMAAKEELGVDGELVTPDSYLKTVWAAYHQDA